MLSSATPTDFLLDRFQLSAIVLPDTFFFFETKYWYASWTCLAYILWSQGNKKHTHYLSPPCVVLLAVSHHLHHKLLLDVLEGELLHAGRGLDPQTLLGPHEIHRWEVGFLRIRLPVAEIWQIKICKILSIDNRKSNPFCLLGSFFLDIVLIFAVLSSSFSSWYFGPFEQMLSLSIVTALLYSHLVSKEYCGDKSRKYKEIRPILNLIASSGKGVCRLFGN